jgi:phosphocarrier protein
MAQTLKFTVIDPVGLYATPATELINTVRQVQSRATLIYGSKEVNLKSMMGVVSLGVPTKAKLTIVLEGEDEERALELVKEKLNELGIAQID